MFYFFGYELVKVFECFGFDFNNEVVFIVNDVGFFNFGYGKKFFYNFFFFLVVVIIRIKVVIMVIIKNILLLDYLSLLCMMFEYIISSKRLEGFLRYLVEEGVGGVELFVKGMMSLVFIGVLGGRKVVIKF